MVRALLDGRKTMKPVKHPDWGNLYDPGALVMEHEPQHVIDRACPYGQPGDRLWVRETWGVISHSWNECGDMVDWIPDRPALAIHELPFGKCYYSGHIIYAADGDNEWSSDDDGGGEPRSAWHPSIHMPRAVSRILLEIVSVRVERLRNISEADVIAEGAEEQAGKESPWKGVCAPALVHGYATLWDQINGPGAWEKNPWVWVVEFKRIDAAHGRLFHGSDDGHKHSPA